MSHPPLRFGRRLMRFAWVLLCVSYLDELASGVPFVGAPEIRGTFELAYGTTSILLLGLPELCSWILEPPLFVLSDRIGKRRLILAGMVMLGGAFIAAGLAPNPVVFAVAVVVIFPSSGLGVALSQAALMDAYPKHRDALMARWTLLGELGDLSTPMLLSGVMLAGGSWRVAMVMAGTTFLIQAAATARVDWRQTTQTAAEAEESFLDLAKAGLRNGRLWLWSVGVAFCGLMDETFVAFAALYLRDIVESSRISTDVALTAYALGGVLGLLALERWGRTMASLRLMLFAAVGCTASYLLWLQCQTMWTSSATLFVLGAFVSPMYPVAMARAYDASPGRAGTVAALGQVVAPVRLVFPVAVGLLADRIGLMNAMLLLLAQPLGLMLIAVWDAAWRAPESKPS